MSDLKGKRALVTGAARGIGAGIARALADRGPDVAITYERSADRAAELVGELLKKGVKAVAIQADSADPAAVKRSVGEAAAALGGLDILVNNAGIARGGAFADTSLEDLNALLNVNVRAPLLAAHVDVE
ncbi:SDR family NAD(P)-dependent oxidoreductase, partial [bacterium]